MGRSVSSIGSKFYLVIPALLLGALPVTAQVAAPPAPAVQTTVQPPVSQMRLQSLVQGVVTRAGLPATVCIYVEDANGLPAADLNANRLVAPASNNKLVTTGAGLTILGAEYKCTTKFYGTGPIANGVLQGDLIIYGGGDPTISGRYQKDKKDITAIMRGWVEKLKSAGINSIAGNLVADDSFFDDEYFSPHWYDKERGEWYEAEVSGLAFNDNCVDITWSGKDKVPGDIAAYTMTPKTDYVNFTNQVEIAAKGRETERYYARGATDNNIVATGNLTVGTINPDSAAVHDGALFCATIFKDVLKKQGIAVQGNAVKVRGTAAKVPASNMIFSYSSPSLLEICKTINLNSQNFYAECVFKLLGKVRTGTGSFAAGSQIVEGFWKSTGSYCQGHVAVDGSGLAGENQVTPRQLVGILKYMDTHGLKDLWRSTLPQGRIRGSLKSRFDNIPEAKRIYGKTGSIGGVRSLSGFVVDEAGRDVYYSIVLNDLKSDDVSKGMKLIDSVAMALAKSGK